MRLLGQLREVFAASDLLFRTDILDWNAMDESYRNIIQQNYEVIELNILEYLLLCGKRTTIAVKFGLKRNRGYSFAESRVYYKRIFSQRITKDGIK